MNRSNMQCVCVCVVHLQMVEGADVAEVDGDGVEEVGMGVGTPPFSSV